MLAALSLDINELLARKRRLVSIVMPPPALGLNVWFAVVGVPSGNASDGGGLLIHLDLTQFAVTYDNSAASARELTPALVQEAVTKAFKMDTSTMDTSGFKKTPKENRKRTFEGIDSLSPRQREVLMLLGKGKSNSEIADELSCSLNTVKRHVTAVLQKLKLPNRTRAAMLVGQLDPRCLAPCRSSTEQDRSPSEPHIGEWRRIDFRSSISDVRSTSEHTQLHESPRAHTRRSVNRSNCSPVR